MKLYELVDTYKNLEQMIEDGELTYEDMKSALDCIETDISTKLENCVKVIKNFEGSIDNVKAEETRLKNRRKSLENQVDSLKNYIYTNMKLLGLKKVKSDIFNISTRKTPEKVVIFDEEVFMSIAKEEYSSILKEKTETSVDKVLLKTILKDSNITIPGVKLESGETLSIK